MLGQWIDDLRRDIAYGLRLLSRSPAFSAVVLTTLAVGIGATVTTTAMGMAVTEEFFLTLALPPAIGRTLTADDLNGPPAVVLSHGLWQRQFGGSSASIGTHVTLNGYAAGGIGPVAIVGRLRQNVTLAAAQAEISAIHRNLESQYAIISAGSSCT